MERKAEIVREQLGEDFSPSDEDYGRPWMYGEWSEDETQRFVRPSVSHSRFLICVIGPVQVAAYTESYGSSLERTSQPAR